MAVIIQNISDHDGTDRPSNYVLRINAETLAYFQHDRASGLGECLRKAADAADAADKDRDWTLQKMLGEER